MLWDGHQHTDLLEAAMRSWFVAWARANEGLVQVQSQVSAQ